MLRTIGLIGGMSWESTAIYYRLANELVRERLGGLHSARIVMTSVDFAEVEELQATGQWDRAGELLAAEAAKLEAAGADFLVLCTNTMHKVAGAIEESASIPLLHLGDVTADAVRSAGLDTVGLLGTAFTMSQDFYRGRLESHGLRVLVPDDDDQALVHRVIYDELCQGVVLEESRRAYVDIVDRLVARGAQGIVLGCTEIELLIGEGRSGRPVLPDHPHPRRSGRGPRARPDSPRRDGGVQALDRGARRMRCRNSVPPCLMQTGRPSRMPSRPRSSGSPMASSSFWVSALRSCVRGEVSSAGSRRLLRRATSRLCASSDVLSAECVGATSHGGTWEMTDQTVEQLRGMCWLSPAQSEAEYGNPTPNFGLYVELTDASSLADLMVASLAVLGAQPQDLGARVF